MHPDIEKAIVNPSQFNGSVYFNKSWALFWKSPWLFIGALFVWGMIGIVLGVIPIIGQIASVLIYPIEFAGFYIVVKKLLSKQDIEFNDFFKGFQFGGKLILPYVLHALIVAIGFVFLIIPGIYFAVAYMFVIPLALFYEEEPWNILEASRKIITKKWWSFFGFVVLLILFNILGLICLGIGLLVTIPVSIITTYMIFEDFVKPDSEQSFSTDSTLLDSDI